MLFRSVHPGELEIVGGRRTTVPEGCRAGFLQSGTATERVLVEVRLCPARQASQGWKAWHTDFDVVEGVATSATLPPKMEFAVSEQGTEVIRVASPNIRGTVAMPKDAKAAAPFRAFPELLGLVVATGIVPPAADGRYEVR